MALGHGEGSLRPKQLIQQYSCFIQLDNYVGGLATLGDGPLTLEARLRRLLLQTFVRGLQVSLLVHQIFNHLLVFDDFSGLIFAFASKLGVLLSQLIELCVPVLELG